VRGEDHVPRGDLAALRRDDARLAFRHVGHAGLLEEMAAVSLDRGRIRARCC
jgi:hypothetical protein